LFRRVSEILEIFANAWQNVLGYAVSALSMDLVFGSCKTGLI